MTPERRAECGRKGGIASGEVRREKKAMKETIASVLRMPIKNGKSVDIESLRSFAALRGKNISVQEAIIIAQIQRAMKGDTRAAEFIRDSSGNKLKEAVKIDANINNH